MLNRNIRGGQFYLPVFAMDRNNFVTLCSQRVGTILSPCFTSRDNFNLCFATGRDKFLSLSSQRVGTVFHLSYFSNLTAIFS